MLFVKIVNDEVNQVWDTPPPAGESGWKSAIEIKPTLNFSRQCYTSHSFDLTKDPVEIVWGVRDLTVQERKVSIASKYKNEFQKVVQTELNKELDQFPETQYDATVVAAAQADYESKVSALNAMTTHEELDLVA